MTTRIFDHHVTDRDIKISVYVHDGGDVQINIMPTEDCWPRITFFLGAAAANKLGHTLLAASTHGKVPVGWQTIGTTTE